jgi:uncharacterized membrane protein
MNMRNKKVLFITQAALIAAIYVAFTFVSASFNLASGSVQMRLSEALCILPFFTSAAIPGLWLGCFLANLLTGAVIWDVIFGSIATLIGALGTYALRKHKFLCTLPPVLANTIIVPLVLIYAYGVPEVMLGSVNVTYLFNAFTVGLGEVIMICVVGSILLRGLSKYRNLIFPNTEGYETGEYYEKVNGADNG